MSPHILRGPRPSIFFTNPITALNMNPFADILGQVGRRVGVWFPLDYFDGGKAGKVRENDSLGGGGPGSRMGEGVHAGEVVCQWSHLRGVRGHSTQ